MLLRDLLSRHAEMFMDGKVVFDWSWPHARYEVKVDSLHRLLQRRRLSNGSFGEWTSIAIQDLRDFNVVKVSMPKRLLSKSVVIILRTDDAMGR